MLGRSRICLFFVLRLLTVGILVLCSCLGNFWLVLSVLRYGIFLLLLFSFFQILLLPLEVVFGQVTALAHAARVVGAVGVRARGGQARLALSIVAVMTHVFGVVPHVLMVTNEKLTHLFWILLDFFQAFVTVFQVQCL